jgi:hypothetical protein
MVVLLCFQITASAVNVGGRNIAAGAAIVMDFETGEVRFEIYRIEGSNYFRLRNVMQALDVSVGFDAQTRNITIDTSLPYIE